MVRETSEANACPSRTNASARIRECGHSILAYRHLLYGSSAGYIRYAEQFGKAGRFYTSSGRSCRLWDACWRGSSTKCGRALAQPAQIDRRNGKNKKPARPLRTRCPRWSKKKFPDFSPLSPTPCKKVSPALREKLHDTVREHRNGQAKVRRSQAQRVRDKVPDKVRGQSPGGTAHRASTLARADATHHVFANEFRASSHDISTEASSNCFETSASGEIWLPPFRRRNSSTATASTLKTGERIEVTMPRKNGAAKL